MADRLIAAGANDLATRPAPRGVAILVAACLAASPLGPAAGRTPGHSSFQELMGSYPYAVEGALSIETHTLTRERWSGAATIRIGRIYRNSTPVLRRGQTIVIPFDVGLADDGAPLWMPADSQKFFMLARDEKGELFIAFAASRKR